MDQLLYQIDLLQAMNQRLGENDKIFQLMCDTSANTYLYYNFETQTLQVMGNWEYFFPFTVRNTREFHQIIDCVDEKYQQELSQALFLEKHAMESMLCECSLKEKKVWLTFEVYLTYGKNVSPKEKIIRIIDITKEKFLREELEYLAYYDSITSLFNRNYFVKHLNEWICKAKEENDIVSVMFIDINDFRRINDGLGLIIGDELVQVFGQFLGEFSEANVIVSHFSSDIFCIAIYSPCGLKTAEQIAKQIYERVQNPFVLTSRHELIISVSIGVAEYPEAALTALDLINCAEIVMLKAKTMGKDEIMYFDAPILEEFIQNIAIEHKLQEAVLRKKFFLYFQPQFDSKTSEIRGVEALLRWNDYDGSSISPSVFIPIAEKNGTIIPIGDWVLEESIRIYADWLRRYKTSIILSINISAVQYKRTDFVMKLIGIIQKYEVDPAKIELEITESVLIEDFEDVIGKMYQLHAYGVRVSLDDFGTGYSSLSYLKGLPIDTLKIDKSFIDTVAIDDTTKIIIESIIGMVQKLGYETVAEGVETDEQLEYLKSINCDNIQGFLLGKPMNIEDMEQLIISSIKI